MFNLEQAIATWREQMISAGFCSSLTLDELESHLREEIIVQVGKETTVEDSFHAAVRRMGQAASLRKEFNKTATKSAREYKIGKVLVVVAFAIYAMFTIKWLCFNLDGVTTTQKALGLSAVALTLVFGFLSISLWRLVPVITNKRKRIAIAIGIAVSCAAVSVIIFNMVMPKFDFTVSQIVVVVVWAMLPLVIAGTVSSALLEAADRRLTNAT